MIHDVSSSSGTFESELEAGLGLLGLGSLTRHIPTFARLASLVLEWNERAGLTTVVTPVDMARKHFLDSLLCLLSTGWSTAGDVVDVGSGAGFPGMVLAVVEPGRKYSLVEAHGRKCEFLRYAAAELGLGVNVVQARAEDFGRAPDGHGRGVFMVGLARAVAPLALSCELVLPLIRRGGSYIAQVGPAQGQALERYLASSREAGADLPAWRTLGAELAELRRMSLPGDVGERWIACFRKTSTGQSGFPRRAAVFQRRPLWVPES